MAMIREEVETNYGLSRGHSVIALGIGLRVIEKSVN